MYSNPQVFMDSTGRVKLNLAYDIHYTEENIRKDKDVVNLIVGALEIQFKRKDFKELVQMFNNMETFLTEIELAMKEEDNG